MTNMTTDDVMEILAGWGSISLGRTRMPRAASSHLKGTPVLWKAEIRIPGYQNEYGQPHFTASGKTPSDAVTGLYNQVEVYFASPDARKHRAAYEALHGPFQPGRSPEKMLPDVRGPEAPDTRFETYA